MDNYLTLKQAAAATGKSERQLRRLSLNPESEQFVTMENGKRLINANFLHKHYPLKNVPKQEENVSGQSIAISGVTNKKSDRQSVEYMRNRLAQLEQEMTLKVALLEQEKKHKEAMSAEKDKRIEVLERSLLMLNEARSVITPQAPADHEPEPPKKKKFLGLF